MLSFSQRRVSKGVKGSMIRVTLKPHLIFWFSSHFFSSSLFSPTLFFFLLGVVSLRVHLPNSISFLVSDKYFSLLYQFYDYSSKHLFYLVLSLLPSPEELGNNFLFRKIPENRFAKKKFFFRHVQTRFDDPMKKTHSKIYVN